MKKQHLLSIVLCAVVILALCLTISFIPQQSASAEDAVTLRIGHITDTHILIEDFCNDQSSAYISKYSGEPKYMEESEEALRNLLDDMINLENPPMYILASGDITINGEKACHERVAEIFAEKTAIIRAKPGYENFQIFAIPGNHDLYNDNSRTFMPTQEELDACSSQEEREALVSNYVAYADSTTPQQFMDIYADFGYGGSKMAADCTLDFFKDSEYFYDDDWGVESHNPPADIAEKAISERNYSILNKYSRHGSCSYIARTSLATFVCVDGNSFKYVGENAGTEGLAAMRDWDETTSGEISDEQFRWILSSIKNDVEAEKPLIAQLHHNVVPHFDMEDDILCMFTYDDYKKAIELFADAGIRYCFTGHMHSSDIASAVSQKGNVIYDFETGSAIAYGRPYRIVDFTYQGAQSTYTEDVTSLIVGQHASFTYDMPRLGDDGKIYYVQKTTAADAEVYFADKFNNMIPDIIEGYINDGLFDTLLSKVVGLKDKVPFAYNLAKSAITQLKTFDLYAVEIDDTTKLPKLSAAPRAGYNLINFADDFANWLLAYDFSGGTREGGYTLPQIIFDVYGGHLTGTEPSSLDGHVGLAYLIEIAQNGTFVEKMVECLRDLLLPQLDLILHAPIRYKTTDSAFGADINGFDFSADFEKNYNFLNNTIKNLIQSNCFSHQYQVFDENGEPDGWETEFYYDQTTGYSSLTLMLKGIVANVDDVLDGVLGILGDTSIAEYINEYKPMVIEYLNKYFEADSLVDIVQTELIDKYVTDALCLNLGDYAARLVTSVAVDTIPDGSVMGENGIENKEIHLEYVTANGTKAFDGHTYNRIPVSVMATSENGLLPGEITIANVVKEGAIDATSIKMQWTNKIAVNVFDKNSEGKYAYNVPSSYIIYATKSELLPNATKIAANGISQNREYPTIDLGILYFNMSYVYDTYNVYNLTLSDLQPNTVYYYKLGNDETGWTKTYTFTTAKDESAESYSALAISDIQGSIQKNYIDSLPNLQLAANSVADSSFIISCGDNVDDGKSSYQWAWLLDSQQSIWAQNSFVGAAGNHEDGLNELSSNLKLPNEGTNLEYYSFFYVNTQYIVLDTNNLDDDDKLAEAQYNWLVNELTQAKANHKVKWIIVSMHKGPYTAGSHAFDADVIALRAQLTPVFAEYGVDVVLQGHDHTYSVSNYLDADGKAVNNQVDSRNAVVNSNGVLYINLGTMGDKYYNYIYSDAIEGAFLCRESAPVGLEKYFADGKLELTETPVFMSLNADSDNLHMVTYTIVDGKSVTVDDILLSHSFVEVKDNSLTYTIVSVCVIAVIALSVGAVVLAYFIKAKSKKIA